MLCGDDDDDEGEDYQSLTSLLKFVFAQVDDLIYGPQDYKSNALLPDLT